MHVTEFTIFLLVDAHIIYVESNIPSPGGDFVTVQAHSPASHLTANPQTPEHVAHPSADTSHTGVDLRCTRVPGSRPHVRPANRREGEGHIRHLPATIRHGGW